MRWVDAKSVPVNYLLQRQRNDHRRERECDQSQWYQRLYEGDAHHLPQHHTLQHPLLLPMVHRFLLQRHQPQMTLLLPILEELSSLLHLHPSMVFQRLPLLLWTILCLLLPMGLGLSHLYLIYHLLFLVLRQSLGILDLLQAPAGKFYCSIFMEYRAFSPDPRSRKYVNLIHVVHIVFWFFVTYVYFNPWSFISYMQMS